MGQLYLGGSIQQGEAVKVLEDTDPSVICLFRAAHLGCARFAFSLISEIKRNWIRFTCIFHYKISLLFFRFFSLIFASNFLLRFTLVIFASKGNKAKRNSSLFFVFFALNFSLRFDLVIFASKRNEGEIFFASKEAKFNIFRIISLHNLVSGEKKHFYQFFRLIFVSLRFFGLIFAYFTFVFASDFWCLALK